MGYIDIPSINRDMKAELDKILAGAPPEEPYIFSLCPSATFDATAEPLMPVLSGSVVYCGSGDPGSDRCDFIGGEIQVLVDALTDSSSYELQTVSLVGVTFKGFSEAAISGSAGSNTTVGLAHTRFEVRKRPLEICRHSLYCILLMIYSLGLFRTLKPCLPFGKRTNLVENPSKYN